MSRFPIPAIGSATGASRDIWTQGKKIAGVCVPNTFATSGYRAPAFPAGLLNAEGASVSGSVNPQQLQTIKLSVSANTDSIVCSEFHHFVDKMTGVPVDASCAIRAGQATGDTKHDALARFVSPADQYSYDRPKRDQRDPCRWLHGHPVG